MKLLCDVKTLAKRILHLNTTFFNPLNPNSDQHSDQHQISPHHIGALNHIQVMRIGEMITKDELS